MITREEVEQINKRVIQLYPEYYHLSVDNDITYNASICDYFASEYAVALFSDSVVFVNISLYESEQHNSSIETKRYHYDEIIDKATYETMLSRHILKRNIEIKLLIQQLERDAINNLLTEINNL